MFGAILGVSGGIRGVLEWQVDWEPDHIGPQSRVPAVPLVPLGSDLPAMAKQVTENGLCRLLYRFGTIFCNSFHICIYATSSHILMCNIQKCYMDYFLCRPIYAHPCTINLTYYDTLVVIMNNYFSHQISELVHVPWVYVQSSICNIDLV